MLGRFPGDEMMVPSRSRRLVRFGVFEVDLISGELRKQGLKIKLHDQPFEILKHLIENQGEAVSREELQKQLWPDGVFVDFDRSLNKAVAKLRDALSDNRESPRFIETIPRHGYRFIAPVEVLDEAAPAAKLQPVAAPDSSGRRVWPRAIESLAVLPLENLSGDPEQEFFADGLTEELVTQLGKVGALRVISHTSTNRFKGAKKPLQEIARELHVDAIVEGTVTREANRVRVTANLVQAFPERHLWAESYDRDLRSALELQSEVARTIAGRIKITITPEERLRLSATQTVNPEANELYLKGTFYNNKWTKEGFERGIEYFNQALQKEPRNARAYAGLAVAYGGLGVYGDITGYPRGKAASLKALQIDDTLAEAHNTLAWAKFTYDWDTVGAERELVKSTRELDPLWLANTSLSFLTYYNAHNYGKAIEERQRVRSLLGEDSEDVALEANSLLKAYAEKGVRGYWIQRLEWFRAHGRNPNPHQAIFFAIVNTRLRNKDEAFRWLEKALKDRLPYLIWDLPASPAFDDLRSDPRYAGLLRRLVPRSE